MYKTSKYTKDQNDIWQGATVMALAEAGKEQTIEQIKTAKSLYLGQVSTQKMAKILSHLIDMGVVIKSKRKDGKMVYKSLAEHVEEGYDIE